MSYREKTAWLNFIAFAITYGPYFIITGLGIFPTSSLPGLHQLGLFAATTVAQMLILAVGYIYLRRTMADEARFPADERDQSIHYRARTLSYYVLIGGMIIVGCVMPFKAAGWAIVNAALFMIVTAELTGFGSIIFSYRRQA